MRQRSTAPLLAVILAAVLSRGKSFSQSLASNAICLPDTEMWLLLPLPLPPLSSSPSITQRSHLVNFSLTHHNLICFFSMRSSTSSTYITKSIPPLHQFLSIFPTLTLFTFFPLIFPLSLPQPSALCCLSLSQQRWRECTTSGCAPYPAGGSIDTCGRAPSPW